MPSSRKPGLPITATLTLRRPSPDGGITPGDVYDLTAFDGYAVRIYAKPNKPIAQFSKNTVTGYSDFLDTTDEATGIVKIKIPAEKTKGLNETMLYVMPIIQADDGGDPYPFSTENGADVEFVFLTSSPLADVVPDLG